MQTSTFNYRNGDVETLHVLPADILASLSTSILHSLQPFRLCNLTVFNCINRIVCTSGSGCDPRKAEIYLIE